MASELGKKLKISVFGQSHGKGIGVVVQGLPAGERVDIPELMAFMSRRAPGQNSMTTARREKDEPKFLSGLESGVTCGFPLCAVIENTDTRSGDYAGFTLTPRPGHADYTARIRYGDSVDMRGGGHFSGRLTAPLCVVGGIAKQILARRGIYIGAHLKAAGGVTDDSFPLHPTAELFDAIAKKSPAVINDTAGEKMRQKIEQAREELDSVGGVVECAVIGMPAGVGDPMFDGVENRLAQALFGIPAVKGVEFGAGFAAADMRGSECNDRFDIQNGQIVTLTNNCGGILGGITNGMPLVFCAAFKPTPSIGKKQQTVNLDTMQQTELEIGGRHDPCVAVRAVPVVEAGAAIVILDMLLEDETDGSL